MTIYGNSFAKYMTIFHKTEIQMVIFRCEVCLNPNWFKSNDIVVVVFPQAPFRVTNVPGQASAGIIQLRNCTMAFLRTAFGDLVTPFVLESCLIIHVLLNLQVHTWGMSLASSGKFV